MYRESLGKTIVSSTQGITQRKRKGKKELNKIKKSKYNYQPKKKTSICLRKTAVLKLISKRYGLSIEEIRSISLPKIKCPLLSNLLTLDEVIEMMKQMEHNEYMIYTYKNL
jgi:hypothetical protein